MLAAVRELAPHGIQPKNARPGLIPGCCKGKAHDAIARLRRTAGAGLPQMVRQDAGRPPRRPPKEWLLAHARCSGNRPGPATPGNPSRPTDPDHMEHARRLLHAVADRARWQAALAEARRRAAGPGDTLSDRKAA